jgi:cytochrome P450
METTSTDDPRRDPARDDRKSGAFAEGMINIPAGSRRLASFSALREIFRSPQWIQGMEGVESFATGGNPDHTPVFFLDGDAHRRRRGAIARYFTPKTISTRYDDVIRKTSDMLIAELRREGSAVLDVIAFQLAVDVTADVVGLTNSDTRGQARRLRTMLDSGIPDIKSKLIRALKMLMFAVRLQSFYRKDVKPAVAARKKAPREDVISHMIKEKYSKRAMLLECMIYGTAGMVTTRELITMAAWHMLEDEALRRRFVDGTADDQTAIIEEILRLEPVAGMLFRAMPDDSGTPSERVCLDIRSANLDEEVTGPCPYALDPDRAKRMNMTTSYMSFGDGPHRCPGAQLALYETRIFLDKLLRLPGIRLARVPQLHWMEAIMGYELRGGIVACDRDASA